VPGRSKQKSHAVLRPSQPLCWPLARRLPDSYAPVAQTLSCHGQDPIRGLAGKVKQWLFEHDVMRRSMIGNGMAAFPAFDSVSCRTATVKSFGRREAYESLRGTNPRAADNGLWVFLFSAERGEVTTGSDLRWT